MTDTMDYYDTEEESGLTFWELLENPPAGCENVAALYSWGFNQTHATVSLFADLIGVSDEEFGENLWVHNRSRLDTLGYLELSYLADALNEYATRPDIVRHYLGQLLRKEVDA